MSSLSELFNQTARDMTALGYAKGRGHSDAVDVLLKHGADVNAPSGQSHADTIKRLLRERAATDGTDKSSVQAAGAGDEKSHVVKEGIAVMRPLSFKLKGRTSGQGSTNGSG